MKLWLDDERDPAVWRPDQHYVWVKTAENALAFLTEFINETIKIDEISFDHDLGEASEGTGYDVASFIEESAYFGAMPRLKWHIHSANPVGHKNIKAAMENADKYWDGNDLTKGDNQLSDEEN